MDIIKTKARIACNVTWPTKKQFTIFQLIDTPGHLRISKTCVSIKSVQQ